MRKNKSADFQLRWWYKWREKISVLSQQILSLKPEGKPSVIAVSKFLLISQLAEFQLRELLLTLGFSEWLKSGKDYISDPADFDNDRYPYTLGRLVNEELVKYSNIIGVKCLLSRLRRLNKQRKQFVHGLFGSHLSIERLQPLSMKGIGLGELVLVDMLRLEKKMSEKQDKYLSRIKKLKHPTAKEEVLIQIWIGKISPK